MSQNLLNLRKVTLNMMNNQTLYEMTSCTLTVQKKQLPIARPRHFRANTNGKPQINTLYKWQSRLPTIFQALPPSIISVMYLPSMFMLI